MKSIFTLLLCFIALTSFSQNELKELKARLVDENGAAVQFANVSLKSADNDSIIAGTSSDENGNFIFNVEERLQMKTGTLFSMLKKEDIFS